MSLIPGEEIVEIDVAAGGYLRLDDQVQNNIWTLAKSTVFDLCVCSTVGLIVYSRTITGAYAPNLNIEYFSYAYNIKNLLDPVIKFPTI